MMNKLVCGVALIGVGVAAFVPLPGERRVEKSPHAAALELVFEKAAERIRAVDRENWWHDVEERIWSVQRPFYPGVIDSTNMFTVSYRIGAKKAAAWQVDTRQRAIEEIR